MPSLPITRAELERILQEYDRPIITGRGVCTFSETNRSYVHAARQWQPTYWALVTNAARDDMVWEFIRYAEEERGWVFIMRHDDGINFVLMPNEAKREKVSRLLGERPRVRNPAVVAPPPPPPPPQHPLIVDVRPDNTDRVTTGHAHQVESPTQPDVASQRRAPSDTSMESSHASWNGILPSLDADAEDLDMEAEVDTDAVTVFTHDTLMEMAMGICSVGSMDSLQLQYAFAATSPVGMDVAFERTMD